MLIIKGFWEKLNISQVSVIHLRFGYGTNLIKWLECICSVCAYVCQPQDRPSYLPDVYLRFASVLINDESRKLGKDRTYLTGLLSACPKR